MNNGDSSYALQNRLAAIVESTFCEIFAADASTSQLLHVNASARKNLGLSETDVTQLHLWDVIEGVNESNIDSMFAPLHNGEHSNLVSKVSLKRKDGSVYRAEMHLQYLAEQTPPIYTAVARDITEIDEHRSEIALRDRAIDAMGAGLSITDATKEGHPLVYVNKTLCDLTGYTAEELIGKPVRVLQKDDRAQPEHLLIQEAQAKGEPVQVTFKSTRKDHSHYMDELTLSPVRNSDGELTHYIGVNRDVTEKLETEKQLRQVQKIDAIGQLSGGIAHDFNNLLSVVSGNLEFLADEITDKEQREYLEDARSAAEMGARLTRRLLTFAKQRDLEISVLQLNDHVLNAEELLRSTIGEIFQLSSNLAADLWTTRADPSEFENTVVNLAINARDAMPKGGKIYIETANLTIAEEDVENDFQLSPGDYIRLSVSDTGTGMTEEVQARIFEPFFTTKEPGKGTGLGLASIYGFAKQSGGRVNVYSELGHGTTVNVYLPRHGESIDTKAEQTFTPLSSDSAEGKILLVEDNDLVRKTTLKRLQSLKYEVVAVADGTQAIELLKQDKSFDLVFSDIVMDGSVSGYDLAHWVQSHLPQCRILLTSGFNQQVAEQEDASISSIQVLQKPYNLASLQNAINETLGLALPEA